VLNFIFRILAGKGNVGSRNPEETGIFILFKRLNH